MVEYSETFKKKMVLRMSGPRAVSATSLSREVNVPQSTLSAWLRKFGTVKTMHADETSPAPAPTPAAVELADPPAAHRTRTAEDKLRLVAQAAALAEQELGALLRREGLHAADLEAWRTEMLAALSPRTKAAEPVPSRPEDRRRIQQLEREVERKDKALAEAAALLLLQ